MNDPAFRLCSLSATARLGLTGLILILLGGLFASVAFIYEHYRNRDQQPRLTVTDIKGAYHGTVADAPIIGALKRGHPPELAAKDREALLDWLQGKTNESGKRPPTANPRLFEEFDNIDAGDANPADILARACVSCHSVRASGSGPEAEKARAIPLDQWEAVKKQATSVQVVATPMRGLLISTHAHALSLGTLGAVLALLMLCTRYPRGLVNFLIMLIGVGLLADIGGWWVARSYEWGVYSLLVGGAVFNGATAVSLLMVLLDLWLPRRVV